MCIDPGPGNSPEDAPVRVAIVDDEPITCEGVIHVLASAFTIEPFRCAKSDSDLAAKLFGIALDVIIVDMDVTDDQDSDLFLCLKDTCAGVPIIVLTNEDRREAIFHAITLGASGYVLKKAETQELCTAVEAALSGGSFAGLEITPKLMWDLVQHVRKNKEEPRAEGLTPREHEILMLMVRGYTTDEIASRLYLSIHTIRTYRQRMMQKLHIRNRTELVTYAFSQGLVELPGKHRDGNGM